MPDFSNSPTREPCRDDFHAAVRSGDLDVVLAHLRSGFDPNILPHEPNGATPLTIAIIQRHFKVAQALLAHGADPNLAHPGTSQPLALMAETRGCAGSLLLIRRLIAAGAELEGKDQRGLDALNSAARAGYQAMVEELLDARADPNALTGDLADSPEFPTSPLGHAARYGYIDICRTLLERGADVNVPRGENSPVVIAKLMERAEIARLFIENGAAHEDSRLADLIDAVKKTDRESVSRLLSASADPNGRYPGGWQNALTLAVRTGDAELVQLLLSNGSDPNAPLRSGNSALIEACELESETNAVPIVLRLLRAGADPCHISDRGITAAHAAARGGHHLILFKLAQCGAEIDVAEEEVTATPLALASATGRAEACRLLLQLGADVDGGGAGPPLARAVFSRHLEIVRLLLESGANPNLIDTETGRSPLEMAVMAGQLELADLLLQHGADPNLLNDRSGTSPLYCAVAFQGREMVELLLRHGADPTAGATAEDSAFHLASGNSSFRKLYELMRRHLE